MSKIEFSEIGIFNCDEKYRYETPRQGVYASNNHGYILLNKHKNFETALADLKGFDRIWILYHFHLNSTWKPVVSPPVASSEKKRISLFATRSPHRPNQIGMSCVELVKIEGLKIFVKNFDLLNGSPILDIKPYIPASDSFPNSSTGWLPKGITDEEKYTCKFDELALKQMNWIFKESGLNLQEFALLQLEYQPLNKKRKRITEIDKENRNKFQLSCRTWRICFRIDEVKKNIFITSIISGYKKEELKIDTEDKYEDKDYHRGFISKNFESS